MTCRYVSTTFRKISDSGSTGNKDFVARTFRFWTCPSMLVSLSIGMETFHTSRLLAGIWSNAGFFISLMASLRHPTFLPRSISTGNMRVESSPSTQQFSRSGDGARVLITANQEGTERKRYLSSQIGGALTTTWSVSLSRSLKILSSPSNGHNDFFSSNSRSLTCA